MLGGGYSGYNRRTDCLPERSFEQDMGRNLKGRKTPERGENRAPHTITEELW